LVWASGAGRRRLAGRSCDVVYFRATPYRRMRRPRPLLLRFGDRDAFREDVVGVGEDG
jgi:hypothetical protein